MKRQKLPDWGSLSPASSRENNQVRTDLQFLVSSFRDIYALSYDNFLHLLLTLSWLKTQKVAIADQSQHTDMNRAPSAMKCEAWFPFQARHWGSGPAEKSSSPLFNGALVFQSFSNISILHPFNILPYICLFFKHKKSLNGEGHVVFLSSFYLELILDLDIYLTLSLRFMTLSLRLCDNRFYVLNAIWQFLLHF